MLVAAAACCRRCPIASAATLKCTSGYLLHVAAQVNVNAAIKFQRGGNNGERLFMEKAGVARDWRGARYCLVWAEPNTNATSAIIYYL